MATAAAPETIGTTTETKNTIYSTLEIAAINVGEKVGIINPIRRIATVDPQRVLKGASRLYNPDRTNHSGMVEHLLWLGQEQGLITNYEVAAQGAGVILGKVIDNADSLQEFKRVKPERQLDYLITHQRRELMRRSLGEAYVTFEFEMDFLGFYGKKGINRKREYGEKAMPDFERWEFAGEEEAVLFGQSFNTFIGSLDFVSRVRPAVEANAPYKLNTEEVVEATFGFFMLNHIFNGGEPKRDERKQALENLGLPSGLSAVQVDHDIIYNPIGNQIGRYLTNLRGSFIRTNHFADVFLGK